MRNINVITKSQDYKKKGTIYTFYSIYEIEDDRYLIRTTKTNQYKHIRPPSLDDARNMINDQEFNSLSRAMTFVQDNISDDSKKFDLAITLSADPNKENKHIVRHNVSKEKNGKLMKKDVVDYNIGDMMTLMTEVRNWFDYGIFGNGKNKGTSSKCW